MRFRSVFFFLCPVLFLWAPAAFAQKRVFASVKPNSIVFNDSADLYDPATGTLVPAAGKMSIGREQHAAIRLGNGKILLAGGYNDRYLSSADIFDPATGLFAATDDMVRPRAGE